MKVIGAGWPRTGTLSTRAAVTRLGLPCYHMAEVALHEDHTRAWYSFLIEQKLMDWKALFSNYSATVDAPAVIIASPPSMLTTGAFSRRSPRTGCWSFASKKVGLRSASFSVAKFLTSRSLI